MRERNVKDAELAIIAIAKEIIRESPGTTLRMALRHAKEIYKHRDH